MKRPVRSSSGPSRRAFLGTIASACPVVGARLLCPPSTHADEASERRTAEQAQLNPIPGGGAPLAPFGVFVHHNPLNPALPVADINDPSQITDFDGFVGLTNIHGGGTGTNTITG